MEQIVTWIKTIFKGSNDVGANFSVPVQVTANLKIRNKGISSLFGFYIKE